MKDFNWKDIKGSRSVILGAILIVAGLVIFVSVFKFIVIFVMLVGMLFMYLELQQLSIQQFKNLQLVQALIQLHLAFNTLELGL